VRFSAAGSLKDADMTPEIYQRICRIFDEAQRLPRADRLAYLDRACEGFPSLRTDITRLLAHDSAAQQEGFLDPPGCFSIKSILEADRPDGLLGQHLGPYLIQERIASGGMGSVYRAVRVDDYHQPVAIKLIRRGLADGETLNRFNVERQVLAELAHPHIARLLDAGTTAEGLPYSVMEYIDGLPIDRYCESRQLSVRERLFLFHQVCLAVDYAHERGIVHRDLKPGNVLVTASGTPKLTDFGLAKHVHEDSQQTQTGQILGTPSYMAPEQAAGRTREVGPLTDVYALGAILYELLTGRPPLKGATWRETLEQVCTQDPVSLRHLLPQLPRDLETICLKCLQKEARCRYPSARALAEDIDRFVRGEPIRARPVSRSERLYRWCRRKPLVAGLLAALLLVTVGGFAGIVSLWLLAEQRGVALEREKDEALRQRKFAEARQQLARQAVDDMTRVAEERLTTEPRMQELQKDILLQALEFYEKLAGEGAADPDLRFRTSQAYFFLARIQSRLGKSREAEQGYRRQIALLEELVREFPREPKYRFDLFHSYEHLAEALPGPAGLVERERLRRQAFVIIDKLVANFPEMPDYRDALANQGGNLAQMLLYQGRLEEAEQLLRRCLSIAEKLVQEFPQKRTPPHYEKNVALNLCNLGNVLQTGGKFDLAEKAYRQAIAAGEKLAADHSEEPSYRHDVARYLHDLGGLFINTGRFPEAAKIFDRCVELHQQLTESYPSVLGYRSALAHSHNYRGQIFQALGRETEARQAFGLYLSLLEEVAEQCPASASIRIELAGFLTAGPVPEWRDPVRAGRHAEAAIALEPDNPTYHLVLGIAQYRAGNWKACVAALDEGPQIPSAESLQAWFVRAMAHWQLGDQSRARQTYDYAAQWMQKNKARSVQLDRLQAEAAAVLAVNHGPLSGAAR
jgi:eukaryotic-like serine/threonine-protein kinase